MRKFPKQYTKQELQQLGQQYMEHSTPPGDIVSLFSLPSMQALHLGHLYGLYTKDYVLKHREITGQQKIQNAIIFQRKNLLSMSDTQQFFAKRRQTLHQVGVHKLRNYLLSHKEKGIRANKKRLETAFEDCIFYREDDPDFATFIQTFITKARKAGKITVKKTIAYWSVDLQTTLPMEQIVFEKSAWKNYTIKYFIETKNDVLPVCTTVPDMIFGDVALVVHPGDKRYKKLIGKKAIIPVVNRAIPVLADESVDISKDNGIKRVCPCCDPESVLLAKKYGLPLDHYVFTAEGKYTEYAGEYAGKLRNLFYPNILQYLDDISNLWATYDVTVDLPYYVHTQEQLQPFLVDEMILDIEAEKTAVQQELNKKEGRESVKKLLSPVIANLPGVLNRQIPRWIALPAGDGADPADTNEVVESEMVSALYLVFLAQQGVKIEPTLFVEEHQLTAIALSLVMQQFCEKKLLYTQAYLLPSLLDRKGDRFSYQSLQTSQLFSLLERYGQSPIRLSLLMHYTIDMEMMVLYDLFLRQLRNGIRYCFLSHPTPLTLEKAWIQFDKKADTVDIWIMSEFYALRQEYELTPSFTLVQQFIQKKLLWWYVEVKKEYGGGTIESTMVVIFTGVLRLLYPFVPEYVRAVLQISKLSFDSFKMQPFTKERNAKVVWLYELFEIILLLRMQLNIKKHHKIALFVKADPNSLALFERHQSLLKNQLNIQELLFVRLHEADPQGYQQEFYQGMVIGMKSISSLSDTTKSKKPSLEELEAQYSQQGEYLQYLRTMIANMSSLGSGDSDPLTTKKQELEKVKERMDVLLVQIQKMKIKGKK